MYEAPLIVFLAVVVPIWLFFHYFFKSKSSRSLSTDDERMLEDVWENTRKMEDRIHTLERILDATDPDWRRQQ